jgi:2-(1,2-epoxy-1,2-dihydrophenyl)acetyl-CoA isomerase
VSTEASAQSVELEVETGAARITLNRPEALNAWNEQFGIDLKEAIREASDDERVRAVLITGAGRAFSSGADLKEQRSENEGGTPDLSERLKELYHPVILGIREMPKPVIAAVNGPAAGIGCSLALCCDLVLAAESSFFLLAFVNIGLVPDGGASAILPARTGIARANEMAMLGERVPAATALEWGLVNRVVPDGELEAESAALLERLASGPTASYANWKRLVNRRLFGELESQLEAEADAQREQGQTADFAEGVLAFLQKRSPEFTGR